MPRNASRSVNRKIRHIRVRGKLQGSAARPRLCVYRSLQHIYAQIIDDNAGKTLMSASTLKRDKDKQPNGVTKTEAATLIGAEIGKEAKLAGVKKIVFDRSGYKYHGRIKSLAEAVRKEGIDF